MPKRNDVVIKELQWWLETILLVKRRIVLPEVDVTITIGASEWSLVPLVGVPLRDPIQQWTIGLKIVNMKIT